MNNKIGIGILDIYDQNLLDDCVSSIPEEFKENVFIASVSNNKSFTKNHKQYNSDVCFATLRNWLLTQMRIKELKYYFLIDSNILITDHEIFTKTIKLAEVFGTWMITGIGQNNIPIEDDVNNVTLNISPSLNSSFMFIYSGIIKNNGYFDERHFNTKDLDVLDYIIKLRKKEIYPPNNFNPTISEGFKATPSEIKKKDHIDRLDMFPRDIHKSLQLSYGYFHHNHKYLPGQNDPAPVSQEDLLKSIEKLQKNYARPQS
jgi:hypothetical protein